MCTDDSLTAPKGPNGSKMGERLTINPVLDYHHLKTNPYFAMKNPGQTAGCKISVSTDIMRQKQKGMGFN